MSFKIYELDSEKKKKKQKKKVAPGIALQPVSKNTKVKFVLLTDVGMLLMAENGINGGICHSIYRYAIANTKYMKGCNKNKESSFIQYWNENNLYRTIH